MPNLIVLFNHALTPEQRKDALASLGVEKIIEPPDALTKIWATIPPDIESITGYIGSIFKWIDSVASSGDYILIQGEFGATFQVVNFCLSRGLVPIYATTRREAGQEYRPDGSVRTVHVFKHVRFRNYELARG